MFDNSALLVEMDADYSRQQDQCKCQLFDGCTGGGPSLALALEALCTTHGWVRCLRRLSLQMTKAS